MTPEQANLLSTEIEARVCRQNQQLLESMDAFSASFRRLTDIATEYGRAFEEAMPSFETSAQQRRRVKRFIREEIAERRRTRGHQLS